jgi:hypothetical protein
MLQLMNALKKARKREGERNMDMWALPTPPYKSLFPAGGYFFSRHIDHLENLSDESTMKRIK